MLADVPKTEAAPVVDEVGRTLFNSNGEPVAYAPHRLDSSWRARAPGVYETDIQAAALNAFGPKTVPLRLLDVATRWAQRQLDEIAAKRHSGELPPHGEWSTVCACGARATRTREQPEAKAHRYVCAMGHQWTDGGAPLCKWCFAACYRDHYAKTWECEAHGGQE